MKKSMYKYIALHFFFAAVCLMSCKDNEPELDLPEMQARSAYDFYHSIGVCTHLGYANTVYNEFDDVIYPRLVELGVRHIRDGYSARMSQEEQDRRYLKLGEAGIKLLFNTGNAEPETLMPNIKRLTECLSGVEGSNEVDFSHDKAPEHWLPWTKSRQKELYEMIKNDPDTKDIPVVNFSLADLSQAAPMVGNIEDMLDYGNLHIYAAGKHPANHWGYNMTGDEALGKSRMVSGDKPVIMTECGYHNLVLYPQSHPGTPVEVSGIFVPHMFFEYFNCGITRSYVYEFINQEIIGTGTGEDNPKEKNFGLLYNDGSPKPAYTALKNLISLIADDVQINPKPLNFQVVTGTELGKKYLRHTLLQKSNGNWIIALYRTNELFDTKLLVTKNPVPEKITLNLQNNVDEISIYIPNKSTDKQNSYTNRNSIEFELAQELVLIEIKD